LTLAADETLIDDRTEVTLTVGDLHHIIRQHKRMLTLIVEYALEHSIEN